MSDEENPVAAAFAQMAETALEEELKLWNEAAWKAGDRAAILIGQHVAEIVADSTKPPIVKEMSDAGQNRPLPITLHEWTAQWKIELTEVSRMSDGTLDPAYRVTDEEGP